VSRGGAQDQNENSVCDANVDLLRRLTGLTSFSLAAAIILLSVSLDARADPRGATEGSSVAAAAAVSASPPGAARARRAPLMEEWRFSPTLSDRPFTFLLAKLAVTLLLALSAVFVGKKGGPWPSILALAAGLLAFNVFLDFGRVGISFNHPHMFDKAAFSPLFAFPDPAYGWPVFVHVALLGTFLALGARAVVDASFPRRAFVLTLFVLSVAGPLTLAFSSPAVVVYHQFFSPQLGYTGHVPALGAIDDFLKTYVDSMPRFTVHAGAHGPGPMLLLAILEKGLGLGRSGTSLSLLALTAFLPLLTTVLARPYLGERAARVAGLLVLLSPSYHLYGFVCMDGVFAVCIVSAAILFLRALRAERRSWLAAIGFGGLTYVGAMLTFSIAYLGLFGACCGVIAAARKHVAWSRLVSVVIISTLTFTALHFLMLASTGFDLWACFRTAHELNDLRMGSARRSVSHYAFGVTGNLVGFLLACGVPTAALWLTRLVAERKERSALTYLALGSAAAIGILLLMGLYQWEVERIWIFLVPLVAVPAARHLETLDWMSGARLLGILGAIWCQTLAWEIVLNTYW
jgi:hypothetical protein